MACPFYTGWRKYDLGFSFINHGIDITDIIFLFKVCDEFMRITTKPLMSKFLYQLDHFSEKLVNLFKPKGGAKGVKIRKLLELLEEVRTSKVLSL